MIPADRHAAMVRMREGDPTVDDLAWLRVHSDPGDPILFRCDCRCRCHGSVGAAVGRHGRCDKPFRLDEFDCERACRAAHVLAGECSLDETREAIADAS